MPIHEIFEETHCPVHIRRGNRQALIVHTRYRSDAGEAVWNFWDWSTAVGFPRRLTFELEQQLQFESKCFCCSDCWTDRYRPGRPG